MSRERIVWYATVKAVEQRFVKQWLGGTGNDAKFKDNSDGWYVTFQEWPAAAHVGADEPRAKVGDRVKMTMEVV